MDSTLPVIEIPKELLGTKYRIIGYGSESRVYNYEDLYAVKIFTMRTSEFKRKRKFLKIGELSRLDEEGIARPIGYTSCDGELSGCYSDIVKYDIARKDFEDLEMLHDTRKVLEYLMKAESILKRLHNRGIILGDIKADNIMIDQNDNPIFVDVDNYAIGQYFFDLMPTRSGTMYNLYGGKVSLRDNDILVFTIMALNLLTHDDKFSFDQGRLILDELVENLNVSEKVKVGLRYIFSNLPNKPYFGDVIGKSI